MAFRSTLIGWPLATRFCHAQITSGRRLERSPPSCRFPRERSHLFHLNALIVFPLLARLPPKNPIPNIPLLLINSFLLMPDHPHQQMHYQVPSPWRPARRYRHPPRRVSPRMNSPPPIFPTCFISSSSGILGFDKQRCG